MNDLVKIVVTVPEADGDMLRRVIGDAGAGRVGNYVHCSFTVKGIGRFLPIDGANPAIGEVGKSEAVVEERIEVTCSTNILEAVIKVIRDTHPYDEPAIDVYLLNGLNA